MKQPIHRLLHFHQVITKDEMDIEIFMCIPRVWWRPWHVNVERIHVGMKRRHSPWVSEATLSEEQFFELIAMTSAADMFNFIAEKEEGK